MVVIRLTRGGSKKDPFYHVVASDKRSPRDGRFIERLGYYHPAARGQAIGLELKTDRIEYWVNQGGQLSDRVAYLLKSYKKFGGLAPDKPKKQTKKAVEAAPAETSSEAPAAQDNAQAQED